MLKTTMYNQAKALNRRLFRLKQPQNPFSRQNAGDFTTPKLVSLPMGPGKLLRNSILCQKDRAADTSDGSRVLLSRHVGTEQVVGVAHAVGVGALVVVGGVDTRADESVADVKAGTQGSLDV